jgi:hypothetical protein
MTTQLCSATPVDRQTDSPPEKTLLSEQQQMVQMMVLHLVKIGVFARRRACTKWQKISSLEKWQHAADGGKFSPLLLLFPDILEKSR